MAARLFSPYELQANRHFVLATYRQLLRATHVAFQDDVPTLRASREYARERFNKDRHQQPGSVEAAQGLEHAQGVTKILRENVVQGKHKGGDLYKLNIHEHTQRMDNTTATSLKGTKKTFKEIKNSQF